MANGLANVTVFRFRAASSHGLAQRKGARGNSNHLRAAIAVAEALAFLKAAARHDAAFNIVTANGDFDGAGRRGLRLACNG